MDADCRWMQRVDADGRVQQRIKQGVGRHHETPGVSRSGEAPRQGRMTLEGRPITSIAYTKTIEKTTHETPRISSQPAGAELMVDDGRAASGDVKCFQLEYNQDDLM